MFLELVAKAIVGYDDTVYKFTTARCWLRPGKELAAEHSAESLGGFRACSLQVKT